MKEMNVTRRNGEKKKQRENINSVLKRMIEKQQLQ